MIKPLNLYLIRLSDWYRSTQSRMKNRLSIKTNLYTAWNIPSDNESFEYNERRIGIFFSSENHDFLNDREIIN
jgi:hypothetical protein